MTKITFCFYIEKEIDTETKKERTVKTWSSTKVGSGFKKAVKKKPKKSISKKGEDIYT